MRTFFLTYAMFMAIPILGCGAVKEGLKDIPDLEVEVTIGADPQGWYKVGEFTDPKTGETLEAWDQGKDGTVDAIVHTDSGQAFFPNFSPPPVPSALQLPGAGAGVFGPGFGLVGNFARAPGFYPSYMNLPDEVIPFDWQGLSAAEWKNNVGFTEYQPGESISLGLVYQINELGINALGGGTLDIWVLWDWSLSMPHPAAFDVQYDMYAHSDFPNGAPEIMALRLVGDDDDVARYLATLTPGSMSLEVQIVADVDGDPRTEDELFYLQFASNANTGVGLIGIADASGQFLYMEPFNF